MQPVINLENAKVFHGSNLDVLPTLPDNSVDSIVTDPPYELGFMGKKWDSTGIAYSVELWTECMRVLKPGGHLLAFGGSRTWHRLAVAIEDAGFEMRDSIAWLYGSGFPKSMDISKQIDKNNGKIVRLSDFTIWMRTTGITAKQVTQVLRDAKLISENGTMASHYFAMSETSQPAIPTAEMWKVIRPLISDVPDWVDEMVARVEAEREVIGSKMSGIANKNEKERHTIGASKAVKVDITAPATDEAKQWEGWGTALKPAFEPVVVARKPLIGTVAENVLTYGTGGLNIDGSRIGRAEGDNSSAGNRTATFGTQETKSGGDGSGGWEQNSGGRWPANIILDPYTAELLDEQSGVSVSKSGGKRTQTTDQTWQGGRFEAGKEWPRGGFDDKGGASRFFYVAKASKRDRNEGLDELPQTTPGAVYNQRPSGGLNAHLHGADSKPRQNFHPTVKPTSLMEYLIKLVTPPNGTVLDPFTGSGSTGKAALLNGFKFIGIELTEEYLPIIEGRLKWADKQAREQEEKKDEALF